MPAKVVDASALGALIFAEPEADTVAAILGGSELIAPALLPFELAGICRKKCRARPEIREPLLRVFSSISHIAIHYPEVDHAEVTALALNLGITTYDAAYLWLATENDAALVTLDRDFAEKCDKVLPPGRILPQKH